jgi:GT2 family glycosyltransferase
MVNTFVNSVTPSPSPAKTEAKLTTWVASIIIPTYNRPERLRNCLSAIVASDYPAHDFEVIVVDDGSHLPIEPVILGFQDRLNLTIIRQANAGPATARNTGIAAATGEFVVFTDDDCVPKPDWLRLLVQHLQENRHCLVGGHTLNALPKKLFSEASQILIDYLYQYFNQGSTQSTFFASNNFGLSRERIQQLGGFNTAFPLAAGEDREFCDRWLQAGYPMQYVPEARINHYHSLNLKTFWRQHFNYGRGAFHFHQLRAQRQDDPIKVEPLSFYWNLLTFPLSQGKGWGAILISLLLLVSQMANGLGFFWEMGQARRRSTLQLPVKCSAQCKAEDK